ncbi:MAG: ABC transporter ATP-binding protein [Halanaeroarchaeum sp.]
MTKNDHAADPGDPARLGTSTELPETMKRCIDVKNVSKRYGTPPDAVSVFENLSFAVAESEFVVILGPSGCGKTTLLEMVAGIATPSSGSITVEGSPIDEPSPEVAMVFQNFVLLPWKTVLENVAMGLKVQEGMDREPRERIAREWIEKVGLAGNEDSKPKELSGGMRQRVGLARALAVDPKILLMDEPFGALDAQTRDGLQSELLELWSNERKTVLFVTHDIEEAIFLADRILVMSEKPATIVDEMTVDIDRPRYGRRLEIESSEAFERAKARLRSDLGLRRD